jgi:hypothetical protein
VASRNQLRFLLATIVGLLNSVGCELINPNRHYSIRGNPPTAQVLAVYDSPEIRRLIADESGREEFVKRFWQENHTAEEMIERVQEIEQHPERYPTGRSEFLHAMANQPGFYVPSETYCRVLKRSESRCGRTLLETSAYELIRVTTGPSRGKQGWVCGENIKQFGLP